ncbi:MAG TPA: hypothetical protein VFG87_26805, partial [Amycolatopsis sp.]|nr:hypothetical protein [Amycolatopsis sp.]
MSGEMMEVHLLAAALRCERSDVESYYRLLSETLGEALPPGVVEVERRARLFGRDRTPVALRVRTADRHLELRAARHGGVEAEIHQVVRDVVISRRTIGVDEWLAALAEELTKLAERDTAAREA